MSMKKSASKIVACSLALTMVLTLSGPCISFAAGSLKGSAKNKPEISIERISGIDRYQTAVEVSGQKIKTGDKRDSVVIASGENFADALSGGGLASILDTSILLTKKNDVPEEVIKEINRLGVKKINLIGGRDSISSQVEEKLSSIAVVHRISGNSRYQTSLMVKEEMERLGASKLQGFANGKIFPDALAAGAYLLKEKRPLILTDGKHLPEGDINKDGAIIFGGKDTIDIAGLNGKQLSGNDRFETAVKIAEEGFKNSKTAILVNGMNYPDALTAISLAKKYNAPIILSSSNKLPKVVEEYLKSMTKVKVVGGPNSVSEDIVKTISGKSNISSDTETTKPSGGGGSSVKPEPDKPKPDKPTPDTPSDDVEIELDNNNVKNNDNEAYKTINNKIDLKIKSKSKNIKKVTYKQIGASEKIKEGELKKWDNWKADNIPLEIGYNTFEIITEETNGKKSVDKVQALRLSEKVNYKNNIKELSGKDANKIGEDFITYYECKEKEDKKTLYAIIAKNRNQSYKNGQIIVINPCEKLPAGMTIKIKNIGKISEAKAKIEADKQKGLEKFNDNDHMVIYATKPEQNELYDGNIAMSFDKIDKNNPIAFISTPNGTSLEYSSEDVEYIYDTRAVKNNTFYGRNEHTGDILRTRKSLGLMSPSSTKKDVKKGFQKDGIKELFTRTGIYAEPTKIALKFGDAVLWDDDGDKNTKNDQVRLKGKFELNDIKIRQDNILPQQIYGKLSYNQVANVKLTTGAKVNIKDMVSDLNKSINSNYENKIELFGCEVEGVEFENKVILCTLGLNLNSVVGGNLNELRPLSTSPMLIISIYLDMYGEVKASASIDYNYKAYIENGANIQQKNKTFAHGRNIADDSKYENIYDDGKYVADIYKTVGRSEKEKDKEPINELVGTAKGEAVTGAGLGLQSGLMASGLIPFLAYIEFCDEMLANFEGSFGYDFNRKAWKNVSMKGDFTLRSLIKLGASVRVKIKTMINEFEVSGKFDKDLELSSVKYGAGVGAPNPEPKPEPDEGGKIEETPISEFAYKEWGNECEIIGYYGDRKKVKIPSKINGKPVTSIGGWAFSNYSLTSVEIPNSVTSIGINAFSYNSLTSVKIPNTVTSIGDRAFYDNSLTSVEIPNSVTSIGAGAFSYNSLTSVEIPNSVTSIGDGAFHNNSLTSVEIPNSVTSIGDCAFYDNSLTSVEIPNSVTSIGFSVFSNNKLTSVEIPNSVTSIGAFAFSANRLTSVKIPNSVTSIGEGAFDNGVNIIRY